MSDFFRPVEERFMSYDDLAPYMDDDVDETTMSLAIGQGTDFKFGAKPVKPADPGKRRKKRDEELDEEEIEALRQLVGERGLRDLTGDVGKLDPKLRRKKKRKPECEEDADLDEAEVEAIVSILGEDRASQLADLIEKPVRNIEFVRKKKPGRLKRWANAIRSKLGGKKGRKQGLENFGKKMRAPFGKKTKRKTVKGTGRNTWKEAAALTFDDVLLGEGFEALATEALVPGAFDESDFEEAEEVRLSAAFVERTGLPEPRAGRVLHVESDLVLVEWDLADGSRVMRQVLVSNLTPVA